jgi:DNA helicase-2/ATP-dependent DNA helicase PcrA
MSINREKLEKKFKEEYEKLNEHQRKAVETIEGPVMVIAGPGTGKTQILASRIGKILLDTDTQPDNILCLTYTDAGVVAMRKRLQQFIGPAAYKVHLNTFHSFCNEVIQDNLSYFEKNTLDPLSELERVQLFKDLIDAFPKDHPLKRYRGDVYYESKNLQQLFSLMKREGWSASFIQEKIDQYLNDLPNRKEFIAQKSSKSYQKGELRTDKIEKEKEKMDRLRAAVSEFDNFQQLMRSRNRYDFEDMINWVIKAFSEQPNLLSEYQERYQYILVDEYQDTSGSQNRLVELLINFWDSPNIFVVGDDDQSIYRFQGANVANMTGIAESYQNDLLTVVLTNNYRSAQPILDVAGSLIERNQERLVNSIPGLSKELKASHKDRLPLQHVPKIWEFQTQRQEMMGLVKKVQELLTQGTEPGRIGIIYREHKYGEELTRYFQQLNIPVYSKRSLDLLHLPLIRKLILLLEYLASEHDVPCSGDEMLFEILHFDWFGIAPLSIAALSLEVSNKRTQDISATLRGTLSEKMASPARDLFTTNVPSALANAATILEKLIAAVPNCTLQQLVEKTIQRTGLLGNIMQGANKHEDLRMLTAFFDFIKEESHKRPELSLEGLVNLIQLMIKENISLPFVQVNGTDKGVNLMTAHGSKGLEFQYVFLAGSMATLWEKKRKPGGGYTYPDNLIGNSTGSSSEEELRRLFYVALTRAEEQLFICFSKFTNTGKELEPSQFIAEIIDKHSIPIEQMILDEQVMSEFAALNLGLGAMPEIEKLEEAMITPLLEKFVMNVTALNNYLKCPLEFYFKNLIRIPSPKNEATEFGSAVHHALEKLFRHMQDSGTDTFPEKSIFLADFDSYMHRHRESFTKEQFARRMEYGATILNAYYDQYIAHFNKIVTTERNIRNVVVKGIPLKGKLDKLEFDGKMVNVVDYKSGDPDKAKSKLEGPTAKNPLGGDYWRQAVFYKILVDHYEQKGWTAVSTEFDFIEPDKQKQYQRKKLVISPADIEMVEEQIQTVWQKIQDRDFYTGCGKEDCHWCNFVKTNQLAVSLHEIASDEDTEISED